MKKLSTL